VHRLSQLQTRSVVEPMAHQGGRDGGDGDETPDSAAHYIAALAHELAQIARRNGLDTLSYILEMARLEADQIIKS